MPIPFLPLAGNDRGDSLSLSEWNLAILPPGQAEDPESLARIDPGWLGASVPGTAMSALFAANRADFEHLPALDSQDVWYRCRFSGPQQEPNTRQVLVLEGLATLAKVWLNGTRVLEANNMFVAHGLQVDTLLHSRNELLILFSSMQAALKIRRPRPRWRTKLVEQQQLRWMRSTLLGRIPGWTPATPAIGPWRPIRLKTQRVLSCETANVRATLDGDDGVLNVTFDLQSLSDDVRITRAVLRVGDVEADLRLSEMGPDTWQVEGEIRLTRVRVWWPHTHGEPVLYPVSVMIETNGSIWDFDLGKTGFRTIELLTADNDFVFKINGSRIFCRGACWTTTDILNLTGSEAATREALLLAKDGGMNMLRVSGTMFYETDHFYAVCDELGILLWHDWMFANMDYPAEDTDFTASVEVEARQFLHRIQLSPCLALLCGNSEVEQQASMLGIDRSSWLNRLFVDVLPRIGAELRPDLPYWPSSPSGGVLPFQVDSGSAHYFGVGAYLQPLTDARRCGVRFTSECLAFANVPEAETVEALLGDGQSPFHHPLWKSRVPRDSGPGWDFEDIRDHYLAELFKVDPMRLRYADMDRYLALSRVVTGEVMASAFAEWRRGGSVCMGGIIWFLQDLWPGAGWGLIDANGVPKAVWHYLKRALAPVGLFITNEGVNGLALHAVNDGAQLVIASVTLTLYRNGAQPIAEGSQLVTIPPRGVVEVRGDALFDRFLDTTYSYRFGPHGHDLAHAILRDETGAVIGSAFFFPLGHAFAVQPTLGLEANTQAIGDGEFRVFVRSQRFAQAVLVDAPGFRISHNYFHLAPGGSQAVRLRPCLPGARLHASISALNTSERMRLIPETSPVA